jgi:hypothetical protein
MHTSFVIVTVYTLVGIVLVAVGPMKKAIAEATDEARRSNVANAQRGRESVSDGRDRLFEWGLSVACIVAWPLTFFAVLQDRRMKANRWSNLRATIPDGLYHGIMGGAGTVTCEACKFSKHIISFTHGSTNKGERCCNTGYQCVSCGQFTEVYSEGASKSATELRCECGGVLSCDHTLFCPNCRSTALRYDMEYIT